MPINTIDGHRFSVNDEGSMGALAAITASGKNIVLTSVDGSPEAIKGAVEAGMGLSVMSKSGIAKELKLGMLASVPLVPAAIRVLALRSKSKPPRCRSSALARA